MPSPITMVRIKAITDCNGCNQCHHCEGPKRSQDEHFSNAMRRAVAISLGATRRPHWQTQERHHEDVVSTTTILIMWWQSLSKDHQLPWRKRDERNQEPGGPLNGKSQVDWAYSCLRSPATRLLRTTTKHTMKNLQKNNKKYSHVTLASCVTHATLGGWATHTIDWHRPEPQWNKSKLRRQQQRQKLPSSFW